MEKPKRSPQTRSRFYKVMTVFIFIFGFVMGGVAITLFNTSYMSSGQTIISNINSESSIACAPTQHAYHDPQIVNTNEIAGIVATGGMPASGGSNQVYNIPVTSVASMNQVPLQPMGTVEYIMPTISGPATYTPMPTLSPAPTQQAQANAPTTSQPYAPNQPQTDLRVSVSAGEIDDNAEWDVYMLYRRNFLASPANSSPVDDVDVTGRQLIRVINAKGQPVLGASVEILSPDGKIIHSSCTYATGYTLFFPNVDNALHDIYTYQVRASKATMNTEAELQLSASEWVLQLDVESDQANLDILFLIDATGSMDDEIAQLTNNILYISEQIHALPDDIHVRYGLVSYKDGYYPTQVWDFTPDVNLFQSQLAQLFTAGGDGETLNDGLDRALHAVQWRGDDTVKLVFLVGDEPPGVYEQHPSYAKSMLLANQAGIKVHPIASSGLDVQGEYIFRQIAQTTMGHFIFLTYGDGATAVQSTGSVAGSAGNEVFGEYSVEHLHEIVLHLIYQELNISDTN